MPFPHVERPVLVPRPALLISRGLGRDRALLWTLMITNAGHEPWPGDVNIPQAEALGLLIPSKVRTAKITTTDCSTATFIGRLDAVTYARVRLAVAEHLDL